MIRFVFGGFTVEFTFLFAATVTFCLLTDESGVSALAMSACLLHELGHLLAFAAAGSRPRAMVFELTGIRLVPPERAPGFAQNLLIQSGGVLANLACGAAFWASGFSTAAAEHVTFAYGAETILSDVSVSVPEHAVVGIVGRSGSGKSTLLKLFMRFWNVQQGSVRLSGTEVSEINTDNLRALESFVTQETHLFHDSIRNNLRIAKLDATDAEIEAACRKASVHDFIQRLPKGYDTPVGELGDTLSGGERQRLGLARAFLHDAPFLLLDEPTSNLDSLNEAVILRALREERGGKTVVLVSHRQSTMRIADTVYSVEHGRMS